MKRKIKWGLLALAAWSLTIPLNSHGGLVALYRFDEASGETTALDSSPNHLNGVYNGGADRVDGKFGTGVLVGTPDGGGVRGFVQVPGNEKFSVPDFTIEFWMLPDSGSNPNYAMPVGRGDGDHANTWRAQMNPGGSADLRQFEWLVSGGNVVVPRSIELDAWQHVAIRQMGRNVAIFIDGELVQTGLNAGLPSVDPALDIFIGKRFDGFPFSGVIDDLAFFDLPLTRSQIRNHLANGVTTADIQPETEMLIAKDPQNTTATVGETATLSVALSLLNGDPSQASYLWKKGGVKIDDATEASYTTPALTLSDNDSRYTVVVSYPGQPDQTSREAVLTVRPSGANLIALWKFDETDTSGPAKDSSANAFDGAFQGGAAIVPGKFGNALQAGESGGFVQIPGSEKFSLPTFTLEFWIKPDAGRNPGYAMPIARGNGDAGNTWRAQMDPPVTATSPRTMEWLVQGVHNSDATKGIVLDQWNHVAIRQIGKQADVFINGVLKGSGSNPGLANVDPGLDIYIGKRLDGFQYTGAIDDVALFDIPLTQSQIQDHMAHGVPTTPLTPSVEFVLAQEPTNLRVPVGESATFTAKASVINADPSQVTYQWQRNDANIDGATGASYKIDTTAEDNGAKFRAIVSLPGQPDLTTREAVLTVKSPGTNLIALYKFEEDDTTQPLKDSSSNGLNGFYEGGAALVEGKFGKALQVGLAPEGGGLRGYGRIPGSELFSERNLSIEFWLNYPPDQNGGYVMPMGRGNGDAANTWRVQIDPGSVDGPRNLEWLIQGVHHSDAFDGIQANTWQHIAIVQTGTTAEVYVDGVLQGTGSNPGFPNVDPELEVYIGKRLDGFQMTGIMDEVALFDGPLTVEQIQDHMANGVPLPAQKPRLTLAKTGDQWSISWTGAGVLQSTGQLQATGTVWQDLTTATSPYPLTTTGVPKYFRLKR